VAGPLAVVAALLWSAVRVVAVPADTRCPARDDVVDALGPRVPDGVAGWVAWYHVAAAAVPSADARLRFELYDRDGHLRLRREMSVGADGCAAAAEGLALIVERYFEQVSWTAATPLPEIAREAEPPAGRRWELQGGLAVRREIGLVPALALDLRAGLRGRWLGSAGLVLPFADGQRLDTRTINLRSLPVRVSVRRALGRGPLSLDVGPALSVILERSDPNPQLVLPSAYRMVVAAGVVGSARWAMSADWALGVEAGADLTLYAPAFLTADGENREVLAPRRVQATAMAVIAGALAP
jgi:hypothetical protein